MLLLVILLPVRVLCTEKCRGREGSYKVFAGESYNLVRERVDQGVFHHFQPPNVRDPFPDLNNEFVVAMELDAKPETALFCDL